MLRPVVVHVTPLAERREVGVRVVGGIVVAVSGGQNHSRGPNRTEHVVAIDREADDPPSAIAPGTGLRVPPAAVAEMPDSFSVRPPAALTAAPSAPKADYRRELRPVDGIEEAVLAPDRHGGD